MPKTDAETAFFGSEFFRTSGRMFGSAFAALGVVILIAMPKQTITYLIVGVHFGLAAFEFLWTARVGVLLGPQGIKIRRSFRRVTVPWPQARRFVIEPHGAMQAAHLEREGGPPVFVEGIGGRRWRAPDPDVNLYVKVREMNEVLEALRPRREDS